MLDKIYYLFKMLKNDAGNIMKYGNGVNYVQKFEKQYIKTCRFYVS